MHVVDFLDLWIAHDSDIVKTGHHRAHHLERRGQCAQRLHVGLRAHQFVMVKHDFANDVPNWQDRARKTLFGPCAASALLAFDGISVDVIAAMTIFCGDKIR